MPSTWSSGVVIPIDPFDGIPSLVQFTWKIDLQLVLKANLLRGKLAMWAVGEASITSSLFHCQRPYDNHIHRHAYDLILQSCHGIADSLALAGEPLGKDELTFHVLNGLGPDFKEISAAIRARDSSITFAELHDKLADYEAFLKQNCPSTISPITVNYVHRSGKSSFSQRPSSPLSLKASFPHTSPSNKGNYRSGSRIICQFCDLSGHGARTYRKLLAAAPWLSSVSPIPWKPNSTMSSGSSVLEMKLKDQMKRTEFYEVTQDERWVVLAYLQCLCASCQIPEAFLSDGLLLFSWLSLEPKIALKVKIECETVGTMEVEFILNPL
ncbi:hypothetical protein FEM48_Zijuj10G0019200 [Ziziphus jujuba var. spinosa]|uniref:Uncharacterized protein n=1 Tax=Ziziphus jujuba var. spinosa TaxID=714518 RepID=A0A978UKL7_ZIZJJ|nr:hypothetical protein FEM48_Zijuj10G0019200 [Ziziphus jujuba var. spinosa]